MVNGSRIVVYGVTGSGKSTLAAALAARTGLPWHSIDDLTWERGWVPVSADEQRRRVAEICAGDRWIIDTAYSQWLDVPLARAEVIVALDYPRWLSLSRLVRRTVRRALDHQPVCNGNTESWRQVFSRDSIIVWHFRSFGRKRARIRSWSATSPSKACVVHLTSPQAAARWLESQRAST